MMCNLLLVGVVGLKADLRFGVGVGRPEGVRQDEEEGRNHMLPWCRHILS